jgi:hypothetical protein
MTARQIERPSPQRLLARILEEPMLVEALRSLEPRALGTLIRRVGLEDCGEIVSLATTEQLRAVFDEDLWKSEAPGKDETFDGRRFALWMEMMLESGEDLVAEKLAELPEDLVTLALHRQVLVVNMDDLGVEMAERGDDADLTEKALESALYEEFDGYSVIAREHDGWNAIVTVLLALDKNDHALLSRILERCCYLSRDQIEENGGLYEVLTSAESLEDDVAQEREERRAAQGFVAPSVAASFLALAAKVPPSEVLAGARDVVTRSYMRDLEPVVPSVQTGGVLADLVRALGDDDDVPRPRRRVKSLGSGETLFRRALATLDPTLYAKRADELAFLCNVLVAARGTRPVDAIIEVAAVCDIGLAHLAREVDSASEVLAAHGADKIFRIGWYLRSARSSATPRPARGQPRRRALQ